MARPHDPIQDALDLLTDQVQSIKDQAQRVKDAAHYPSIAHEEEVEVLLDMIGDLL